MNSASRSVAGVMIVPFGLRRLSCRLTCWQRHVGTARAWDFWTRGRMAKLTESKKKAEPSKEFGLPEQRKYPMPDASHARNAKARASQMEHQGKLSVSDKKKIDAKANKVMGK